MSGIEIGNLESLHTLVFSSLEFLFRYLPLFLILFYAVPKRFRMFVLFAFSLILYALGDPVHVLILLGMSVVNWLFGYGLATEPDADGKKVSGLHGKIAHPGVRGLRRKTINWSELQLFEETVDQRKEETYRNTASPQTVKKRKFWLAVSVLCNASLLIFFKLSNVFEENMLLPVGISFYTFKSISYLIDVYRSGHAERSFLRFGAYLCCFPQIVSGPIMRYGEMEQAQQFGVWKAARAEDGLKYITAGLGMKVLLADRLGFLWNDIQTIGFESISTPLAWLGAAAYSMELYFDFAGYSLIAVGIGRMIGLPAIKNFDQPYSSRSVSEFYRRWHMTLGSWFRDYLYIPLGGNRKGTLRTVFNLLLVWAVTGFWHGGGLHFILWGMILGLLVVIEKLWIGRWLKKSKNFIPCICTVRDSTDLDGVCNSDPAGNRRLFRTAVPVLWRGQRGQSRGFRKRTDTVYSGACRRHFCFASRRFTGGVKTQEKCDSSRCTVCCFLVQRISDGECGEQPVHVCELLKKIGLCAGSSA